MKGIQILIASLILPVILGQNESTSRITLSYAQLITIGVESKKLSSAGFKPDLVIEIREKVAFVKAFATNGDSISIVPYYVLPNGRKVLKYRENRKSGS